MDRRRFLRLGVGSAALLAMQPVLGRDPTLAQPAPGPFGHGIASGDPLADRVILWTRVTPEEAATPGSEVGPPTEVAWEVAADAAFAHVLRAGSLTTAAASDHTVKVDVDDLPAATDLWYRFRALGATSPVGRTRTAPAPGAAVNVLRVGVVSCSNYEGGWFSAYRHLAAREDLDLVAHLGDYVYEYGVGGYGPGPAIGRSHDPDTEMVTLADYRRRHALYKTDADLAALHRRYPVVTTIDDHEVTNNAWADGAENHQAGEGGYASRRAAVLQAYFEWMPIRVTGGAEEPSRVYRASSFGDLVDLFVLDERTYRSQQVAGAAGDVLVTSSAVADPDRTMLGAAQRTWLEEGLAASSATWRVVLNPVMFSPFILGDLPDLGGVGTTLTLLLGTLGVALPAVLNGDQWDGYAAEQARLRERFGAAGNVVLLTGDIHSSWASEVPADPGSYLPGVGGDAVAVEFVVPGVTSDGLGPGLAELIPGVGGLLADNLPTLVGTADPWFKFVDVERHGYGVLEVTADHVHHDWFFVSDRTDPRATVAPAASFRATAGSNRLTSATPLGPRPPRPVPAAPAAPAAPVPSTTTATGLLPATGRAVPVTAAAAAAVAGLAAATVRAANIAGGPRRGGDMKRREFLARGAAAGAAAGLGAGFWDAALAAPAQPGPSPYGELRPPDRNGLMLPPGFTSRVVASSLLPVGGTSHLWHIFPDGGACVPTDDGGWIYVSNSEFPVPVNLPAITGLLPALKLALAALQLPIPTAGGVGAIRFAADGSIVDAYPILTGSVSNCAGGLTPWGTWLSCEEWEDPDNLTGFAGGRVWECDPTGARPAVVRPTLGLFKHEMAACDPDRQVVYLSEDQTDGLLYRYTPPPGTWGSGDALEGGELHAMALGDGGAVSWIRVADFTNPSAPSGPLRELVAGAAHFNGGEGILYDDGHAYLTTKGDDRVWVYDLATETMTVLYDSSEHVSPTLTGVDNIAVSAAHDLYVAEDGGNLEVCMITPDRVVASVVRMTGPQHGPELIPGVPTVSEVTGLALSPDGNRLYFNSERGMGIANLPIGPGPGILYEVTGPFRGGTLAAASTGASTPAATAAPAPSSTTTVNDGRILPATGGGAGRLGPAAAAAAAAAALVRLRRRAEQGEAR